MEAEANVVPRVYAGSADFLFVDDDTRFIRHFQKILQREVVVAALWILTQQLLHGAPAVFEVERNMDGFAVTEQTELDVSVYSAAKSLLRIWSGRY